MIGESAPANNVIVPWNTATGRAEKMQPRPSEAVMVQTMMQSSAPLRASVDQSPSRPSWIDPTMAMAPMHTVSEVETKALVNSLSPSLPVLRLSHSPRFSMAASKLMASPMSEPSANETMSMVVPVVASAFPSMMSIFCMVPPRPINRTHSPDAFMSVSWMRGVMKRPPANPKRPPATKSATLMIVPKPGMSPPVLMPTWQS